MKKETHICSGYNKPSATGFSGACMFYVLKDFLKCTNKATLFENGKWWCKRHAPSKVKEREEKSWEKYIARIRKNVERNS